MATLLIIIHAVACLFLIAIVLVQGGKGAEIGAAFGGSSQTLFGSRGATTFLSKLTTAAAVVFMLTSLTLSMIANRHASVVRAVMPAGPVRAIPAQLPQQPLQQQPAPQQPQKK